MRYGSVCSGIEAATVAWHPLGWTPAFFSEIEPFPSAVLAHHYPEVPNHGDFTKLIDAAHPVHREPPIDLLVGGTPCQAFSVAGLRAGLADPRGGLTLEFLRLARALRPKWIVWENVPGVLSQDGGRAFGAFLGGLEDLGYGWAYRVVDAQYTRVDGYPSAVPQRRKRVFVVGHSSGRFDRAAAVLFEPEGVHRNTPPRRETGEGAATPPVPGAGSSSGEHDSVGDGGRGRGIAFDTTQITSPHNRPNPQPGDPCHPLAAGAHPPAVAFAQAAYPDVCGTLSDGAHNGGGLNGQDAYSGRILPVTYAPMTLAFKPGQSEAAGATFITEEFAPTLQAQNNGSTAVPAVLQAKTTYGFQPRIARKGRGDMGDVASALNAQSGQTGKGDAAPHVAHAMAVRRLTPVECERLQGFPDGYTAIPWKRRSAEECPDGGRYKALGNSMAVNCMRWIGRRIELVEASS